MVVGCFIALSANHNCSSIIKNHIMNICLIFDKRVMQLIINVCLYFCVYLVPVSPAFLPALTSEMSLPEVTVDLVVMVTHFLFIWHILLFMSASHSIYWSPSRVTPRSSIQHIICSYTNMKEEMKFYLNTSINRISLIVGNICNSF